MDHNLGLHFDILNPQTASIDEVKNLFSSGEEPRRILQAIVELCKIFKNTSGAQILSQSQIDPDTVEPIAQIGDLTGRESLFDIFVEGAVSGYLQIFKDSDTNLEDDETFVELAFLAGRALELLRNSENLQHYMDRVQVLHELNQVIATNVNLDRVVKSITRESAFRFAADITIVYLLNTEDKLLTPSGSYGFDSSILEPISEDDKGIIGQSLKTGGLLCIPRITKAISQQLGFAEELNLLSINLCSLEVRGETHGLLVAGFTNEIAMTEKERARFEEFAQAATVAIANARTQERIKNYSEKLEELVQSRTQDLEVQTQKAEAANQAKSQFLANMSHELRTPLTAIVGYSSVLSEGIFGAMNERQVDAMLAITRSSDHLKNLIDDVLNLARIESGKEAPEPKAVSLQELVQHSYKLILQNALNKGLTLAPVSIPNELKDLALWVDQKHIQQIMINILSNAVKYTPTGGKVWITFDLVSDKIKINVHDTGVGIPPSKINSLFERFERGEDTYSKSQEGTGIGLNLTKRLVELNGGIIGASSEIGSGSVFWVMIPVSAQSASSVIKEVRLQDLGTRLDGISAVVIDDNIDTCEVVQTILSSVGASVVIAHSVSSGIDCIKKGPPDIIITDLAMPGETGLSLVKQIRSGNKDISKIPIIVMSACAFPQDQQSVMDAGASSFLPKPFKPVEIVTEIRRITLEAALKGTQ